LEKQKPQLDKYFFSLLMTAFNREDFIKEAIESVLEQDFTNWELIIVDDASIDTTYHIAESYTKLDKRIKLFRNDKNIGDYHNRNLAASYGQGTFLVYIDSDDRLHENILSYLYKIVEENPTVNFGISNLEEQSIKYLKSKLAIERHFFIKPFLVCGPGDTFIRREFFNRIEGFSTKYGPASDMFYNLKVSTITDIVLLPKSICYYRVHSNQESKRYDDYLLQNYLYLKDALEVLPFQLSSLQKKWIKDKNNRRFLTNLIRHCLFKLRFQFLFKLLNQSKFSLSNLSNAIFQKR
jgi:glycosyltransferase involved in cell wall biosynthesis